MAIEYEAVKFFREIYPESNINIVETEKLFANSYLVTADFPDGRFFFKIGPGYVSSGYENREKAIG